MSEALTLSRALAERVVLIDFTVGRKGFLTYLKSLGGSNIVKIVPSNGSAGGSQANGQKRLKVVSGTNTSYLDDMAWVGEKPPLTLCDVRVSPSNTVKPPAPHPHLHTHERRFVRVLIVLVRW